MVNLEKSIAQGKTVITLIGVRQAREGYAFIHQGSSPNCKNCGYYRVCIENLEEGRVYRVVGLRENVFQCGVHEGGVRVVEVVESDIEAALPLRMAMEGALIPFQKLECEAISCINHEFCVPRGLVDGDRCTILKIDEKIECPEGLSLVKVLLHRLPST